jgi:hypothetical protein
MLEETNEHSLGKVSVPSDNTGYSGRYIISNCIECTNESVCLLYQIKNTATFGHADHLEVYTYKVTNILCIC